MSSFNQTVSELKGVLGKTCVDVDELLALSGEVPRLQYYIRLIGAGQSTGDHSIDVHGQGMSYIDTRPFVAGDDVRRMDWRVMARTNELYAKVFDNERSQTWWLVVDARSSMAFGTHRRFKLVQAARIAALLAATGLALRHSVGLVVLNDTSATTLAAGQSREQVANIAKHLSNASIEALTFGTTRPVNTVRAFQRAGLGIRDGEIVFVLSDFLGWPKQFYNTAHRLAVRAIRITDRLQTQPLPVGHYPIHDGDRRIQLTIKHHKDALAFLEHMQSQIETVNEQLKNMSIPVSTVDASVETDEMVALLAPTLIEPYGYGGSYNAARYTPAA